MSSLLVMLQVLIIFSFLILVRWSIISNKNSKLFTRWPFVEMLPAILKHLFNDIYDFMTEILQQCGYTFEFKGPWFTGMDFLLTSDPANVNHIFNKNLHNYFKGPDYAEIFDHYGDGILNVNYDAWKYQRRLIHSHLSDPKYEANVVKITKKKVLEKLMPILDHFVGSKNGIIDVQDLVQRLSFDVTCYLVLGCDVNALSLDFPKIACLSAFHHLDEVVFHRHLVPIKIMRIQKWLEIGREKNVRSEMETIDRFINDRIVSKLEKTQENVENEDLLTSFIADEETCKSNKFLKDTMVNLIVGGNDTLSSLVTWFFLLVSKNPSVQFKILEEIRAHLTKTSDILDPSFYATIDDVSFKKVIGKMIYLHATLSETLRLYPPIPISHRTCIESETLPSGHRVNSGMRIIMPFYTMGRMQEIWGEDCLEFKPERWISSSKQDLIHVPSQKFIAFNTGLRTCLGKSVAYLEAKTIVVIMLQNYHMELVDENPNICPTTSMIIQMKHGLKVKITKRNI